MEKKISYTGNECSVFLEVQFVVTSSVVYVNEDMCPSVDHPYCDFDKYEGNLS